MQGVGNVFNGDFAVKTIVGMYGFLYFKNLLTACPLINYYLSKFTLK